MHRPPATLASAQIFRNGKVDAPSDYNGPREQAGIVSYLEKISGPASAELKTAKEVRALEPCCLAVTALNASAAHRSGLARTPFAQPPVFLICIQTWLCLQVDVLSKNHALAVIG